MNMRRPESRLAATRDSVFQEDPAGRIPHSLRSPRAGDLGTTERIDHQIDSSAVERGGEILRQQDRLVGDPGLDGSTRIDLDQATT